MRAYLGKAQRRMKLLQISEIAVTDRDYAAVRPNYAVPCINPCEYVPYKPLTGNEKAALAGWMEQEFRQAACGPKHIADNFDQRAVSTYGGLADRKPTWWP